MNLSKRLEALEAAVVAKAKTPEVLNVIRLIIDPDGRVTRAYRRAFGGAMAPVSDEELAELRERVVP